MFPPANIHNASILDFVPPSNPYNILNPLCICSANQLKGRAKDILLIGDNHNLQDKLISYCNQKQGNYL